jgi:hypothetical protein
METLMTDLRKAFNRTPSMEWRSYWSDRGNRIGALTSWRAAEAHRLVKLAVLRPLDRERELGLYVTAYLNEIDVERIDKVDGLVEDHVWAFIECNKQSLAGAILSGGDE